MATTYGSFPGVQVTTAGGGITAVAIGAEEKLVIFGEANYARDGENIQEDGLSDGSADGLDSSVSASTESVVQPTGRTDADNQFGAGTQLAEGLKDAIANGANADYLYGVAPERYITQESPSSQTGTLSNTPIFENTADVLWDDDGTDISIEFRYDGAPATPTDTDQVFINPFTGEYAVDSGPTASNFTVDYRYVDYSTAFGLSEVKNTVNEDETGVYVALEEADPVSADLNSEVADLRDNFKMVNGLMAAEPNDNSTEDTPDPRYDTSNYNNANQSVDSDHFFKFAPTRIEDSRETVLGGVGGLFAGNPITDPVYNDALSGYGTLEESFTKTQADNMRNENIIPIRQAGSIRVKDNLSTSTESDWERDFWRRRITDRVILIGKTVGDATVGKINDEQTRAAARRLIEAEMRDLVDDRLLKPNTTDETNWTVEVVEDSSNADEIDINISFTPYGIAKRIDETITINA